MTSGLELHEAAAMGDTDSMEEYLNSKKIDVNLRDPDFNDRTALHWASAKGYVECIRLLLEHGADGTATADMDWTPAHFAAETGKLTVLRALVQADIPIYRRDKYGDKPADIARMYGHQEMVRFLKQEEINQKAKRVQKGLPANSDDETDTVKMVKEQ
ncbi:hypothetical protein FSP39_020248 [Pinctada imbricata]|uniref:Uncharacterized protein n=1 Tax=Pinctada imbricata TaxID=66713 RepID=A0AA88YAY6_PINIB|nr:hypothetical protein FSP39_020248 [Pinctada imbricata]